VKGHLSEPLRRKSGASEKKGSEEGRHVLSPAQFTVAGVRVALRMEGSISASFVNSHSACQRDRRTTFQSVFLLLVASDRVVRARQ
jgi:hypothetical protein